MKRLAPDLFDRRFAQLIETGRARLPGLAPDWTDYNAHDPGITLMELLAWVTEAQLYSLGRMRRDERAAYAALFGLAPGGTQAARGLIWPDRLDSRSPAAVYTQSRVIAADAVVNRTDADEPTFRPEGKLLWVAAHIRRLEARLADGRRVDYTVINERGGPAFQPFGAIAGRNDVLVMELECRSDEGLFPPARKDADGALWSIGVRADKPLTGVRSESVSRFERSGATPGAASLTATLVTLTERIPLRVVADTSDGLLRTGALLLDLSAVNESPKRFSIELRAARGFERPPRILRIEPNVLPIVQGYSVANESHTSTGIPDWSFRLDVPGLRFDPFESPVKIEQLDASTGRRTEWRSARLEESGPDDAVFEFDLASERVAFGNGVNGRIPPQGAQMLATYAVSAGEGGGVAANRKWRVLGFAETFGVNIDAMTGGAAATDGIDERREARRRSRDDHALVSAADIEQAALTLPLLEVARAWVLSHDEQAPRTGTVTLVAMRARRSEEEAGGTPETPRWLEAIRRRLAARMPLATRLVVVGPRYIEFSIRAKIEVSLWPRSGTDQSRDRTRAQVPARAGWEHRTSPRRASDDARPHSVDSSGGGSSSRRRAALRARIGQGVSRDQRAAKRAAESRSCRQPVRDDAHQIGRCAMTAPARRAYRFNTPAQWGACLFDRVDREVFAADGDIRPIAPYGETARRYPSQGAHAPVVTRAGEVLWRDDAGCLHRLTECCETPEVRAAPYALARASRIVSTSNGLWVVVEPGNTLERYEQETLSRLSVVSIGDARVIDLASDGYDLLFALIERDGAVQALRIDCAGRVVATVVFEGLADAKGFVYLGRSKRFVVLAGACPRLSWFAAEGGKALTHLVVGALHPCFSASVLGCDARGRVFLAGADSHGAGW